MTEKELNEKYASLLIDDEFEQLDIIRNRPNIFEVLRVNHYEIRHSNFLGWLLDPKGNHSIGDYFLKRVLVDLFQDSRSKSRVIDIHNLLKEDIIVHREKYNIDLLIEFESIVIVIENKIHSLEGNNQLYRYKEIVEKEYNSKKAIYVYLTKFGNEASLRNDYIELSYGNILGYLKDLITYRSDNISNDVIVYLNDYIDNYKKNIMKDDQANVFAEKIYRKHRELFDFIIANKPDPLSIVKNKFSDLLRDHGFILGSGDKFYLRFLPKEIFNIVPKQPKSKGWKHGEAFLLEFIFNNFEANKIKFQIAISSYLGDEKIILKNIFDEIGLTFNQEVNKEWYVFEWSEIEFDIEQFNDDNYIKEIFRNWYLLNKQSINNLTTRIQEHYKC